MRSEANRESKDVSKLGMVTSRVGEARLYLETKSFRAWAGVACNVRHFFYSDSFLTCDKRGGLCKNGVLRRVSIAAAVCEA